MSKYLIGSLVTLVIIAAVGGAYLAGRGQLPGAVKASPTPESSTAIQATATPSPASTPAGAQKEDVMVNPSKTIAQIEASVSSKNYQALEAYMTSSVNVVVYASECCGKLTATKATAQLDYLSSATPPWNFKDNNPIAAQLQAKSDYFKGAVIGTASNRYAVGFKLNSDNKISDIALVADYELITK